MSIAPAMAEPVSLKAAEWVVALQADDATPATHEACRRWRAEHPTHEQAWRQVESFGAQLRGLHSALAHGTLVHDDAGAAAQQRHRRRQAVKLLALVAVAGGGAWSAHDSMPWREWRADHRTGTGERRTIVLADGTQAVLNTATAIDVQFDAGQRRVTLVRGEIQLTTAPDAGAKPRPFFVATAQARLQALGTRFTVRQQADATLVGVFEGAVEIRPAAAPDRPWVLQAGQQTRVARNSIEAPQPVDESHASWTKGMLVVHEMPLADFLAELARYRLGHLGCDPAIGDLKVSGIYPIADTERVLDMLLRTQPVEVLRVTRYWTTLRPRGV